MITYLKGDLIEFAQQGRFDVIVHGCNCFNRMKSGIAAEMIKIFGCDEYPAEKNNDISFTERLNRLGTIEFLGYRKFIPGGYKKELDYYPFNQLLPNSVCLANSILYVVNAYTQFYYRGNNPAGSNAVHVNYTALESCLEKINLLFAGKRIGLPKIGAGLANGNWDLIQKIITEKLNACDVYVVEYEPATLKKYEAIQEKDVPLQIFSGRAENRTSERSTDENKAAVSLQITSSEMEILAGVLSKSLTKVTKVTNRVQCTIFGIPLRLRVDKDQGYKDSDRVFIQFIYESPCNKEGKMQEWRGRKWYLSEYMTEDEIMKTCYAAFEAAVKHEIMEGFKVDGKVLFNPHVNFEELLKISDREVYRT